MTSRRTLRQKTRISYYEPEEPSLDEYIFCDQCSDFVYEYCALHGPLLVIPDDKVPSKSPYPDYVPRAALTIPHVFLHLAPSIIPGAGLGVFTTLTLPRGVRFGPYCGVRTKDVDSMYCWQIYDRNNKRSHVIDAADGNRSNWMRYVNCARHWREQNLLAYQYQGQLYYRTIKIIPRFTELMVFYGSEFANKLHINLSKYNSPPGFAQKFGVPVPKKPKLDVRKETNENAKITKCKKNVQTETKIAEINKKSSSKCQKDQSNNSINIAVEKSEMNDIIKTVEINSVFSDKENVTSQNGNIENNLNNKLSYKDICKEQAHKCNICEKSFSRKSHLVIHLRIHTGQKPYKCNICEKSFRVKCHLVSHTRIHTGKKPYKCDICEKSFSQKYNLVSHIRIHTGQKPYKCDICEKSFNQKCSLVSHIRIHTGQKPYKCDICEKSFNHKCSLVSHIRIHTGQKPYKCDICEKSFSQKCSLVSHIRIHTGQKPYKCDICEKSFNQKCSLVSHIRIHTGQKPYKCDICEKSFNQKCHLVSHIRKHTTL